jgi:hypothetical protein
LVIGFIGLLQIITANNCSAVVNSRTLQITVARAKSSQFVFASHHLVMAPNNVDSSASVFNGSYPCWLVTLSHMTHAQNVLTFSSVSKPQLTVTLSKAPITSPYIISVQTAQKTQLSTVPQLLHEYPLPQQCVY